MVRLWQRILDRLGLGSDRAPPRPESAGWRVLAHLGIDGNFVTWAQRDGQDTAGIWAACPRADWLVRMAAGAGVERRKVVEAVVDCVDRLPRAGGEALHAAARDAARRWLEREVPVDELCRALGLAINEALDSSPELRRARVARRAPVGRRFPEERISADVAERSALSRLAELVRRRIPFEDVRSAIWRERGGDSPYR